MATRTVLVNGEAYAKLITLAQECAAEGSADRHSDASAAYNELVRLALQLDATLNATEKLRDAIETLTDEVDNLRATLRATLRDIASRATSEESLLAGGYAPTTQGFFANLGLEVVALQRLLEQKIGDRKRMIDIARALGIEVQS